MKFSNQKILNCIKQLSLVLFFFIFFIQQFSSTLVNYKFDDKISKNLKIEVKKSNSVILLDVFDTQDEVEEDELDVYENLNLYIPFSETLRIYTKKKSFTYYNNIFIVTQKQPLYILYCTLKIAVM